MLILLESFFVQINQGKIADFPVHCIDRESNPELGHGKTQCYRYTINATQMTSKGQI